MGLTQSTNQPTQKLILYGSVYGIQKKHSNLSDIHSNKTKTNHYISPGKYRVGTWKNKIKKTSNQPTWKKNPLVVIGASIQCTVLCFWFGFFFWIEKCFFFWFKLSHISYTPHNTTNKQTDFFFSILTTTKR